MEKPSNQFGGVSRETAVATTNEEGSFSAEASVGAAITLTGEYAGDVYQSGLKTFVVRSDGYEELEITLGYGCPELLVYIKAANNQVEDIGASRAKSSP